MEHKHNTQINTHLASRPSCAGSESGGRYADCGAARIVGGASRGESPPPSDANAEAVGILGGGAGMAAADDEDDAAFCVVGEAAFFSVGDVVEGLVADTPPRFFAAAAARACATGGAPPTSSSSSELSPTSFTLNRTMC
jgi:hypothetical protein